MKWFQFSRKLFQVCWTKCPAGLQSSSTHFDPLPIFFSVDDQQICLANCLTSIPDISCVLNPAGQNVLQCRITLLHIGKSQLDMSSVLISRGLQFVWNRNCDKIKQLPAKYIFTVHILFKFLQGKQQIIRIATIKVISKARVIGLATWNQKSITRSIYKIILSYMGLLCF